MIKPWKRLSSVISFQDRWLTVRSYTLERPDGALIEPYHIVEENELVCIFALTDENEVVAIEEYRVGPDAMTLGLIGGIVDDTDEDIEHAALREFEEETGYRLRELVPIGRAYSNWARHNNQITFYIGFGATPSGTQKLDATEEIEPVLVPFEKFMAYDFEGPKQTHHAAALFYVERYFAKHPEKRPA